MHFTDDYILPFDGSYAHHYDHHAHVYAWYVHLGMEDEPF